MQTGSNRPIERDRDITNTKMKEEMKNNSIGEYVPLAVPGRLHHVQLRRLHVLVIRGQQGAGTEGAEGTMDCEVVGEEG
jgi:hypothetical protein